MRARLYFHTKYIDETLFTVLETFSLMENVKKHRPAAITLYHLLQNSDEDFTSKLNSSEYISILKYNPYFSSVFASDLI